MKTYVGKLLAMTLDFMGFSVIIGCKVKGEIKMMRDDQVFYSSDFVDTTTKHKNEQEFTLPEGKFAIKSTLDDKDGTYKEWFRKVVNKKNK
ncbi:hypothetical protein QU593_10240 [Rossellomorea marisflavi]|uniref:hypothetical protein n=1 Tax=Rossellomorea marisflavi TaxID=189381 RepID=UPI0025B191F4|nr:hypothetical protein [Rossellomorea marisflavi]WJV20784.1 hypothetical protein QU593_10240 [Rossellomorea marisflavi]